MYYILRPQGILRVGGVQRYVVWYGKEAAVGGLFMKQPSLNGISVGGPFFANPLG